MSAKLSRYKAHLQSLPEVHETHTIDLDGRPLRKVWVVNWFDPDEGRRRLWPFGTESEAQRFARQQEEA